MRIAEALRLLRKRQGLTQTAASKLEGAPDPRTLSHWETSRKLPSLKLLRPYLKSLGFDFCDLEEALSLVEGTVDDPVQEGLDGLRRRVADHERRLQRLEAAGVAQEGNGDE